jgi:ankyrin repeat protein
MSVKCNNGMAPIHWATMNRHINVIKALGECGADVSVKDKNGVTPMHIATIYPWIDVVGILIELGSDYLPEDQKLRGKAARRYIVVSDCPVSQKYVLRHMWRV